MTSLNPSGAATTDAGSRLVSRRALLAGAGVVAAGAVGGSIWYERGRGTSALTVARWQARRGARYFIAHRGAGDVVPEHTVASYEAALGWGAQAIEVSTSSTADGVLICMHDLTYDRTTTGKGLIHAQPSSVLTGIGVTQPQLGPKWSSAPLTPIPLLDDILTRIGGRTVLCIEAKRDEDYDAVVAMIAKHGLRSSVVIKLFHRSTKISAAKAAGYPVFVYFGGADVSEQTIGAAARNLDHTRDCLVLPTTTTAGELPDAVVTAAVRTGVPTWVYPVHRRSEADRYYALGASGIVTSSVGYSSAVIAPTRSDNWSTGAVAAGQISRDPVGLGHAPLWRPGGVLTLARRNIGQHFLLLGQFSPVILPSYTIQFDARWDQLSKDPNANLTLAFGQPDDRYYQHRLGTSNGFHAIARIDGSLQLFRHQIGQPAGIQLGQSVPTPAPVPGQWMQFSLRVDPAGLTWRRSGGPLAGITVDDATPHGGYLHIGRSSDDGALSFRNFSVF